jgi:hypothetical protein
MNGRFILALLMACEIKKADTKTSFAFITSHRAPVKTVTNKKARVARSAAGILRYSDGPLVSVCFSLVVHDVQLFTNFNLDIASLHIT